MKYLGFVLLVFVLTGCEKVWTVEQIIENSTGHDIKIKTYHEGKERETVTIDPNGNYALTRTMEPRNTYDMFILNTSFVNSVNIIFDNEKAIVQSSSSSLSRCAMDVARNIMCLSKEYVREDVGTRSIRYTYTITEEDYNNAVPIED